MKANGIGMMPTMKIYISLFIQKKKWKKEVNCLIIMAEETIDFYCYGMDLH